MKIKDVADIFDYRNIEIEELRKKIVEVDFVLEFNDKRSAMTEPKARVKIDLEKGAITNVMLLDDGTVTRKYRLSGDEKEFISQYTLRNIIKLLKI